ncbi:MAG TPA: glycosyl hydrolase family 28-related protein, partial [Mycobacterium sp.]
MGGVVVAAGLGLALSTGYGVAAAEPSDSPGATADSGPVSEAAGPSSDETATADPGDDVDTDTEAPADPVDAEEDPDEGPAEDEDDDVDDEVVEDEAVTEDDDDRDSNRPAPTPQPSDPQADTDRDGDAETITGPASEADPDVAVPEDVPPIVDTPAEPEETAEVSVDEPVVPQAVSTKPVTFFGNLLSSFGTGNAPPPAESPMLLAVLAWVRRQFADANTTHQGSGPQTSVGNSQPVTTVNVRDYGAVGDGVTDDSAAIKAAEAALTSGSRLYFPEGDYRFAQQHPAGDAAILLRGLSNVTVEFAPGARLLMDNLDANGHGTGHGIRVEGAASHVTILNA